MHPTPPPPPKRPAGAGIPAKSALAMISWRGLRVAQISESAHAKR